MQNWDIALEELNRLKEIIDSKVWHLVHMPFIYVLLSIVYLVTSTIMCCRVFHLL